MMIFFALYFIIPLEEGIMNSPILNNLSSIFQTQENQNQNNINNFDLSDDTFSNILDEKLDDSKIKENFSSKIQNQLGVPAGLDIEGFDYNSLMNEINPDEMIDSINTDSNIQNDSRFNIGNLIDSAKESFSPVVDSILQGELNTESGNPANPVQAVKNFWESQASNFYSIMNKESVDNVNELISKL